VVVGTRGFGTLRILLLGAVSAAVALHSRCPVAVVCPGEDDGDPAGRTSWWAQTPGRLRPPP
jgi:hypothetical protein